MSTLVARQRLGPLAVEHLVGRSILLPWGSPTNPAILGSLAVEAGLSDRPRLVGGIDGGEATRLFTAGHADFLMTDPVTARTLEIDGAGLRTESFAALTGDLPWGVMFMLRSARQERSDPVARFAAAVQRAREELAAGRAADSATGRAALSACLPSLDPSVSVDVVRRLVEEEVWHGDLRISESDSARVQRMLIEQGILARALATADYCT
jgi:hypothetical protein